MFGLHDELIFGPWLTRPKAQKAETQSPGTGPRTAPGTSPGTSPVGLVLDPGSGASDCLWSTKTGPETRSWDPGTGPRTSPGQDRFQDRSEDRSQDRNRAGIPLQFPPLCWFEQDSASPGATSNRSRHLFPPMSLFPDWHPCFRSGQGPKSRSVPATGRGHRRPCF